MEFFNSAVGVLQTLVVALGAGLGIWGVINLLEGYGQDNRPLSIFFPNFTMCRSKSKRTISRSKCWNCFYIWMR